MSHHAEGTFEVKMQPVAEPALAGISRMSMNKQYRGSLEATAHGVFLSAGDPSLGEAGYVAMEQVTGTLDGHSGGFMLQHFATMDRTGQHMQVRVVPGSGTGALTGLAGELTVTIIEKQHRYTLEYTLPTE
ncbi:DUF3224 domain-containing protein [Acidipila sp. EB88]|uniref:DUF3224 domain-containing protein n=1 Tax=Acidipila sp. EB88 TaxID=2305226 RepID=UPI000F5E95E3|nr:DUF3224 domain-containing protein [Acidipila sp. EB88]RRA50001.1 DUF3224 domain-containing protein [Acidipila sp. EB88]